MQRRSVVRLAVVLLMLVGIAAVMPAATAPAQPTATAAGSRSSTPVPVPGGGGTARAGNVPGPARPAQRAAVPDVAGYPVSGIDIASYQHPGGAPIDWAAVARSGVRFAYIKATEGTAYVNPYYQGDAEAARRAGLYVGAYAFVRPDSNDAVAQADKLLAVAPSLADGRTLPPMVDIEWPYSGSGAPYPCWGLTPAQITAWLRAFVSRIQGRIGRVPTIYTNNYWWDPCTGNNAGFGSAPLIIAHYNGSPTPLPSGWANWTIWQYTSTYRVLGISGYVDADVFHGDLADLAALAGRPGVLSSPSAVVRGAVTTVFTRSLDGKLNATDNSSGGWRASSPVVASGVIASAPSAVVLPTGEIEVYATAPDRSVWQIDESAAGAWTSWEPVGGRIDGAPSAVVTGRGVSVFGTAVGLLWVHALNGMAWTKVSAAGRIASAPSAVALGADTIDVYAAAPDRSVWRITSVLGTARGGWASAGGLIDGAPSSIVFDSQVLVYGTAVSKLWQHDSPGLAWSLVTPSGVIASAPAAITVGGGIDVFATAPDRSVWHISRSAGSGWTGWRPIA